MLSSPFMSHLLLVFIVSGSLSQFVRECEARLVEDYKVDYLYAHVRDMITKEKRYDLSNLFVLLNGIPKALIPVVEEFQEHVQNLGELGMDDDTRNGRNTYTQKKGCALILVIRSHMIFARGHMTQGRAC